MDQVGHVFISYAAQDVELARRVNDALKAAGIITWLAEEGITSGQDWQDSIDDALRKSTSCVVLLSPTAARSAYVTSEWRYALRQNLLLYPVMIERVPVDEIPTRLNAFQWIDLFRDFDAGMDQLISAIHSRKSQLIVPDDTVHTAGSSQEAAKRGQVRVTFSVEEDQLDSEMLSDLISDLAKKGVSDVRVEFAGAEEAKDADAR